MPDLNLRNAIHKVNTHKGPLTKSLVCRTAKRALNHWSRGWLIPDSELAEAIQSLGMFSLIEEPLLDRKLDDKLTQQGIEWLRRFCFKANGEPRNHAAVREIDSTVFKVIKNFSHFTFAGFCDPSGYSRCTEYVPAWTVWAKNGDRFTYRYIGGPFGDNGPMSFVTWNISREP